MRCIILPFAALLMLASLSACSKCDVPTFGWKSVCADKTAR
jgi:outer membrane protein assembly factor BamE (lipoprotein component of BamABCDE complex)